MGRSGVLVSLLLLAALAGCGGHGGTTSSGAFEVVITDEDLQAVTGNRCGVEGNATNAGNVRARVELTYEALDAMGAVIGTSTGSFEVAPFSNFRFGPSRLNTTGQPSSGTFDAAISCADIARFRRTRTRVTAA
jgi:hypothetical protein